MNLKIYFSKYKWEMTIKMREIKELFTKVYEISNPNKEQLQTFIELLKGSLTVRELEYVSYTYNIDFLGFEELESRIVEKMKQPLVEKKIMDIKSETDEVDEILEKIKDNEYITISLIQRKCSMGFCSANKIFNLMVERNMIIPTNTKKGYRITKGV